MSETLKKFLMLDWLTWQLLSAVTIFFALIALFAGKDAWDLLFLSLIYRVLRNQEEQK